jgi:hypothetical protein
MLHTAMEARAELAAQHADALGAHLVDGLELRDLLGRGIGHQRRIPEPGHEQHLRLAGARRRTR